MTNIDFIETAALYTRIGIRNFTPPLRLNRMCEGINCNKETTWALVEKADVVVTKNPFHIYNWVSYRCGLCGVSTLVVMYELLDHREDPESKMSPKAWMHSSVRKVGQIPPVSPVLDKDLREQLGTTVDHYKKALVSRENGYGIGAMAYLRRVVDEKTDQLIDVIIDLARTYDSAPTELKSLETAKSESRYSDKLRVAKELVPLALRPGGVNPLGQLYEQTSAGLHEKSDAECIAIFDDLKADFEYIFRNLHLQAEERRAFVERIQRRAGRKDSQPAEADTHLTDSGN